MTMLQSLMAEDWMPTMSEPISEAGGGPGLHHLACQQGWVCGIQIGVISIGPTTGQS